MKRQRILFIKDNYVLRILKNFMFAGLYIIALLLILIHKVDLGIEAGASSAILYISAPIINIVKLPAIALSKSYKKLSEITDIYQENKQLRKDNKELYLLRNRLNTIEAENKILKNLLHHFDTPATKSYTARVIAENGNSFTNSLILYLGKNADKIKPGYAVVNQDGLIGRIDIVSGKYARVTLITDINSKIPVISKKSRDRGILIGNNTEQLKLLFTPLLAEFHKGDLLVTSGSAHGLPQDIPVARIIKNSEEIIAKPLFSASSLEIIKIIAYDILPDKETLKELE